jgi:hypothetical protein
MHCIYFSVSHVHNCDRPGKQGPEETPEPAQVGGINREQDQGKPQCI